MYKKLLFSLCFVFFLVVATLSAQKSFSDELDDLTKQINDLTSALNQSKAATTPLESQLKSMQAQITTIKARVAGIEADIATKKESIDKSYKDLAKQQEILGRTIRSFYIKSHYSSPMFILLSSSDASEITQILAYQKAATDQDKAII